MLTGTPVQTYAAFIVPDPSDPQQGIAVPCAVKSRNIHALDIPPQACAFYFYEAAAELTPGESLRAQKNVSKVYLLASEILDRQDVKVLIAGDDFEHLRGMQWDPRVEQHDIFVVTRNHAVQPVTDRHIVIDAQRRQIYPALDAGTKSHNPPDMAEIFNPVLQKDVLVPRLGNVQRRPRPPSP